MPRLPELPYDTLDEAQRKVHDEIASGPRGGVRGPFGMLLHSPHLADRVQKLGEFVHYRCAVPGKLRELVGLMGHYCLVAMTINVFEIPPRDGSAPFGI